MLSSVPQPPQRSSVVWGGGNGDPRLGGAALHRPECQQGSAQGWGCSLGTQRTGLNSQREKCFSSCCSLQALFSHWEGSALFQLFPCSGSLPSLPFSHCSTHQTALCFSSFLFSQRWVSRSSFFSLIFYFFSLLFFFLFFFNLFPAG